MKVLVTGHNGYIGSVMVPTMQAAGFEVVGQDTFYFEEGTLIDGVSPVEQIRKDIRDLEVKDLEGIDAVAHLAALCNDPLGDLNPDWTYDINHHASIHLARLCKEAGVERFLYSSSCSMYGAAGDAPATEEAELNPLTPYAVSKVRTEEDLHKLADSHFSPVYMRNATAYGVSPRLRADVVLNNLMCWAFTTRKIKIMSDGTPWRPIVHIGDISNAFVSALKAPREVIHDQAFNVGVNGENYQIRQLADIVHEVVPECEIEYSGQAGPDPRNYKVDFSKITNALGDYKPEWNARAGAEELFRVFKEVGLTLEDFQGRKFIRLSQLKYLLENEKLDETLRWK